MRDLTTLDLSSFDTSQVTDMRRMFSLSDEDKLIDKLEKIYVNNDFNTTNLTNFSGMFENRKKLRGGNGSYLLILQLPTNPGFAWIAQGCRVTSHENHNPILNEEYCILFVTLIEKNVVLPF